MPHTCNAKVPITELRYAGSQGGDLLLTITSTTIARFSQLFHPSSSIAISPVMLWHFTVSLNTNSGKAKPHIECPSTS